MRKERNRKKGAHTKEVRVQWLYFKVHLYIFCTTTRTDVT